MAETVHSVEGNMIVSIRTDTSTLSGSKSMACNKSRYVNVGDPNNPIRIVVSTNKLKK